MATVWKSSLSNLYDASYGIPFDVSFDICSPENRSSQESKDDANNENDKELLKGHKLILATISPVFRNMFFGSIPEKRDVIPVKETTFNAFKTLIEYIYSKDIAWKRMTVEELFDVINLAEKYDMPCLLKILKTELEVVDVSEKNIIEVASVASKFAHFSDASDILTHNCVRYLRKCRRTSLELLNFLFSFPTDDRVIASELICLASKLSADGCENCGQASDDECRDWQSVTKFDDCRFGLRVGIEGESEEKIYTIVQTSKVGHDEFVEVQNSQNAEILKSNFMHDNVHSFVYRCK